MIEDEDGTPVPEPGDAANDYSAAEAKVNAAVLTIARLIGRQIAREDFERRHATNEDQPTPKADEDWEAG